MPLRRLVGFLPLALLALPAPAGAQIKASERGTVSQTIDGTVITLDYARPRLRGRDTIFGGLVHWKEVWTPGANWATTFEVSKDMQLDGHRVPKGKYSMWYLVEPEQWTLILDPRHHRFHTNPPDSTADQIRYVVHPAPALTTEVLTFSFPAIRPDGGELLFQWAQVQLPMAIKVEPSHPVEVAKSEVAGILGRYRYETRLPNDSTPPSEIVFRHENGRLMAHWERAPWPELNEMLMIRIADDWYTPAILEKGEIYEVISDWVFEFTEQNGKATGFEIRGESDKVEAVGTRL